MTNQAETDYETFIRLFCDDDIYSQLADDSPVFSSEEAMAERALICNPENRR